MDTLAMPAASAAHARRKPVAPDGQARRVLGRTRHPARASTSVTLLAKGKILLQAERAPAVGLLDALQNRHLGEVGPADLEPRHEKSRQNQCVSCVTLGEKLGNTFRNAP